MIRVISVHVWSSQTQWILPVSPHTGRDIAFSWFAICLLSQDGCLIILYWISSRSLAFTLWPMTSDNRTNFVKSRRMTIMTDVRSPLDKGCQRQAAKTTVVWRINIINFKSVMTILHSSSYRHLTQRSLDAVNTRYVIVIAVLRAVYRTSSASDRPYYYYGQRISPIVETQAVDRRDSWRSAAATSDSRRRDVVGGATVTNNDAVHS